MYFTRKSVQPPLFIRHLISNLNSVHPYAPRVAVNPLLLHHLPSVSLPALPSRPFRRSRGSNLSKSISSRRSLVRGVRFVCFNSTARFDNSPSYIRRVRDVAASELYIRFSDQTENTIPAPALNRSRVVTYMGRVRLMKN